MTRTERLTEDKRRRQQHLPTLDYELMTKIKGSDAKAAAAAKYQLWDKYQDSVNKRWQDFISHVVDKNIASRYDKDEYMQNAAIAFENAIDTVNLDPNRKNKKGEPAAVKPDKFLFYIVLNGYLMSMNRDLAAHLYKVHSNVSIESRLQNIETSKSANAFDNELAKSVGSVSAEQDFFRNEARQVILKISRSKTVEGQILSELAAGKTPAKICKTLNLRRKQYSSAFESLKHMIVTNLPDGLTVKDLLGAMS